MPLFVDEKLEPRAVAYLVGAGIAVMAVVLAHGLLGWPLSWFIFPISVAVGLFGVFMIESGCEAAVFIVLASIPLVFLIWHNPDHSLLKQLFLTVLVGHSAGKLWVGVIR